MGLFKDFGKPAKDLLGKNYGFGERKIEINSSAGDAEFDTEWSSKGNSKMETHYKMPNNTSLDVEFESNSNVNATAKMKNVVTDGLTLKGKLNTESKMFFGLEYMMDNMSLTADAEHQASGATFNFSTLYHQNSFSCGGNVKVLGNDLLIGDYAVGLGYSEPKKFEVTAKVSEGLAPKKTDLAVLVQYIHYINSTVTCGASFQRTLVDAPKSTTTLGGTYKLNGGTKLGLKIDSDSKLGMHAIHQLNDDITLTQSLQLDVSQASSPHKFGFNLKFKH